MSAVGREAHELEGVEGRGRGERSQDANGICDPSMYYVTLVGLLPEVREIGSFWLPFYLTPRNPSIVQIELYSPD